MPERPGTGHPDSATLLFEREQWNRLYHEQGARLVALEKAIKGLLVLAERVGQGINPAHPALLAAREALANLNDPGGDSSSLVPGRTETDATDRRERSPLGNPADELKE